MNLYFVGHDYRYAAEQILLMLFPGEKPEYPTERMPGDYVEIKISRGKTYVTATCCLSIDNVCYKSTARGLEKQIVDTLTENRVLQKLVKLSFYRSVMQQRKGEKPVWGALTGIRPGKMVSGYLQEGMTGKGAVSRLIREYDVSPQRAQLCLHTAKAGHRVQNMLQPRDICLYIGIPFCPTRCAYCSFVSQSVSKSMRLIEPFFAALLKEIQATAQVVKTLDLRVISVYIGGGTPTTLSPEQLHILCSTLETAFDLCQVREYTVEAGRPDTITREKLSVLDSHNISRVSVNPQTMEDRVLEKIGRKHTAQDVLDALMLVWEFPKFSINMDLIAGLPEDSAEGFSRTLDTVLDLAPENITVHTLSLKKGSKITLEGIHLPPREEVSHMLDETFMRLPELSYTPYYLYRQKYISGGFENVGFCKKDEESLYNICIMEELCSILSMGGGASTKLVASNGRIERIFNPKYPLEYIENIEKIMEQKQKITSFYEENAEYFSL